MQKVPRFRLSSAAESGLQEQLEASLGVVWPYRYLQMLRGVPWALIGTITVGAAIAAIGPNAIRSTAFMPGTIIDFFISFLL